MDTTTGRMMKQLWDMVERDWQFVFTISREQLIDMLCWNDPNGCYTDEDCEAEGFDRLTKFEAIQIIAEQLRRNE